MAGESAHELARRQREKAERLLRSAEMWERGGDGEQVVGAILDQLRPEGWEVFHDVRWPGRQRANLDHVAIGPTGVFVIDAKNWSGRIDVRGQSFRCNGRRQDRTVAAAGDAALAVAALLNPDAGSVTRSALCFVRDEPVSGWCYEVMLCSTANLREMLVSRPAVLTPDQVKVASVELQLGLRAAVRLPPTSRAQTHAQLMRRTITTAASTPRPPKPPTRKTNKGPGFLGTLMRFALVMILGVVALGLLPRLGMLIGDQLTPSLTPAVTEYSSCALLHQDYPRGVGTKAAVRDIAVKKRRPAAKPEIYQANVGLDVDRDGLACESPRGRR